MHNRFNKKKKRTNWLIKMIPTSFRAEKRWKASNTSSCLVTAHSIENEIKTYAFYDAASITPRKNAPPSLTTKKFVVPLASRCPMPARRNPVTVSCKLTGMKNRHKTENPKTNSTHLICNDANQGSSWWGLVAFHRARFASHPLIVGLFRPRLLTPTAEAERKRRRLPISPVTAVRCSCRELLVAHSKYK